MAWAVGYPVAFVVLFAMALRVLELSLGEYLRRAVGIPALAAVAMAAGAGVRWLAADAPSWVRLTLVSATMAGLFFLLLAYREGISPRSVFRAVKGD
jgi:uncharacterized membrane protein YhhN